MIVTLKFVHFFAIALGVGGGFAGLLLGIWARDKPDAFKATLGVMQGNLARLGFVSILLLWLSGAGLMYILYGGFGGIWLMLWVKLLLVTALTLLAGGVHLIRLGALPARLMAAPARRMKISLSASTLTILILLSATLAFN